VRFQGKVYKDGKFWLAEIPILDAMTQGYTRKEAYIMVKDLLETLANRNFQSKFTPANTAASKLALKTPGQ